MQHHLHGSSNLVAYPSEESVTARVAMQQRQSSSCHES
jgi:hypothetical protein